MAGDEQSILTPTPIRDTLHAAVGSKSQIYVGPDALGHTHVQFL